MANNGNKHEFYEILNLIGYGLSKFNIDFVHEYGFKTKSAFYEHIISLGIAETIGTVKNRQDLFDGMTPGGLRKGWWQKGAVYKHRKDKIDELFGNLAVSKYVEVVKIAIESELGISTPVKDKVPKMKDPILRSQFKKMQETGLEAEYYFLNNYKKIKEFESADIKDARLLGDGYDFQMTVQDDYFLAEVKGIKAPRGGIRLTANEYEKAIEYKEFYSLIIVSNIIEIPQMIAIFNPLDNISFERRTIKSEQVYFQSSERMW